MSVADKIKEKIAGNEKLNSVVQKAKTTTKEKKGIVIFLVAAVLIALAVTVVIHLNKKEYEVLFPGMSQEENTEVYTILKGRNVDVQRNADGEVLVNSDEVGNIMLDMAALGYPKTTLSFDIFSDNTGFTTTEFEKKQYLLLNLQDRIEKTLQQMSGIGNAIVTLSVPDEQTYVWDTEGSSSTASISLTLTPGYEMSAERVSAIKNLVANSVPNMTADNVTVVDASTMKEFEATTSNDTSVYGLERLDFESKVEAKLTKKIENVLSLGYSPDQYRVSTTVVIDYDKMITENLEYVPQEDGDGVVEHSIESGNTELLDTAGGVVGEEDNTDVSDYTAEDENNDGTNKDGDYYRELEYVISYIKQQIEKDAVKLEKATVSIVVDDENLTQAKRQAIVESASKAANVDPEDIVVNGFAQASKEDDNARETLNILQIFEGVNPWILIAVAAGILLLIIIVLVISRIIRRKQDAQEEEIFAEEELDSSSMLERAEEDAVETLFEQKKDPLTPAENVKEFAKNNPEIIAAMLSSWLKEEE